MLGPAVTTHRPSGLNCASFFWRIDLEDGVMTRIAQWRDLGRPEAALLGVQYIGNDMGEHRGAWLDPHGPGSGLALRGDRLERRGRFSNAGIEIDHTPRARRAGRR